jgi:hypothetical protein
VLRLDSRIPLIPRPQNFISRHTSLIISHPESLLIICLMHFIFFFRGHLDLVRFHSQGKLAEQLEVMMRNYKLVHPEEKGFPGELILFVEKDAPILGTIFVDKSCAARIDLAQSYAQWGDAQRIDVD